MDLPAFDEKAFELLRGIQAQPTVHFYHDHKEGFKTYVERPLQGLMNRVALRLPPMIQDRLETRRNVFSRFPKNDFGRGLAWANYWGAFYPKGSRRIMDAQLAMWMNFERLHISFYINDYGLVPRARFLRNCARHRAELPGLLKDLMKNESVVLAREGETQLDAQGRLAAKSPMRWDAWLDAPDLGDYWVFIPFTPEEAVRMPAGELEDQAVAFFSACFPLVLLAMEEEPLSLIEAYQAG